MLAYYRADVAEMYQTEIDRHLFATASFRPKVRQPKLRRSMFDWLRTSWLFAWAF